MEEIFEQKYPEHIKLEKVQKESQSIGEFLEWLTSERKIILSQYATNDAHWPSPINATISSLLADYFGIDQSKLEKEKQRMLQELRKPNK